MKKTLIICLVVLLVALAGCGVPNAQNSGESSSANSEEGTEITVAGNGGKIEQAIRDVIAPKFTEETGIEVNFTSALSGEILSKVELQKNAPTIDVAFYVPLDVQRSFDKGLVETLDVEAIPNLANIDERFVAVDTVGAPVFGYVIAPAYNTETFESEGLAPIESWNDLVREEYGGKTAFADIANDWGFTILYNLAAANGGNLDNLEPGLQKAKDLAAYSDTFYKNSTQMMPAMQQGAADVTVMGSYAIAELSQSGVPIQMVIPEEGAPMQAFTATIVKDAPNMTAAQEFVNYIISEESQALISESGFYPVLKDMEMAEIHRDVIGIKEGDNVFGPDVLKLSEIREEWTDRWSKEVTSELGTKVNR